MSETNPNKNLNPVPRNDELWPEVRSYLLESRHIAPFLVEDGFKSGSIYANQKGIVFALREPSGKIAGASIFDPKTNLLQLHSSTLGTLDAWYAVGDMLSAQQIIAVKSPIDALSFATLRPATSVAIVSVDSCFIPPSLLTLADEKNQHFLCALENSPAGDAEYNHVLRVIRDWPNFKSGQLTPKLLDWNEDLCARKGVPIHSPRTLPRHL